jgi:hypothetical protein
MPVEPDTAAHGVLRDVMVAFPPAESVRFTDERVAIDCMRWSFENRSLEIVLLAATQPLGTGGHATWNASTDKLRISLYKADLLSDEHAASEQR